MRSCELTAPARSYCSCQLTGSIVVVGRADATIAGPTVEFLERADTDVLAEVYVSCYGS